MTTTDPQETPETTSPAPSPAEAPNAKVVTIDVAPAATAEPAPVPPSPPAVAAAPAEQAAGTVTAEVTPGEPPAKERIAPGSILAIDVGGTKVKILATGQTEPRKALTGPEFTPGRLVETVGKLAGGWDYEAISIGVPALVGPNGPRSEPGNLGPGWVGFDYAAAFGKPVKMVNDAAMQALGSYEGGRMLFLGLGTGLGSTLIAGHVIVPLELGRLMYDRDRTLGQALGRKALAEAGKKSWRKVVHRVAIALMGAFVADYVVIGGGNAKNVKELPPGARRGHNLTAFRGGFRLWSVEDVWVLAASGGETPQPTTQEALRML
jgi:polyphosphate glucokinase